MAQKVVQSVDRALKLLDILIDKKEAISLSEISEIAELNISTTHRLLNTLVQRGFVTQTEESSKYKLGYRLFEIAGILEDQINLKRIVRPYLEEIVEECNETANLVVLDGAEVVYIDQVESTNMMRMFAQVGSKGPAHSLGSGKALLAYVDETKLDKLLAELELKQFTENTITEPEKLKEHLKEIREQGYAVDNEEMEEGVSCAAAPIRNRDGKVIAAISVSGPNIRIDQQFLQQELVPLVKKQSEKISRKLKELNIRR